MGNNIPAIHTLAWEATVTEMSSLLRKQHSGKKIIVAYDPEDRLGGVDKTLLAFAQFLDEHSQSLTTDEYFALRRSGDLALFTSVRDGMSTTSLDYVVCQQGTHGPVLISEFSGTASNPKEAIHINPWDTTSVVKPGRAEKKTEETE
jgi:trehalose-6-phosphate synthase